MLTEADGRLSGLFTDSDLARLFEDRADDALDAPVERVMTKRPVVIGPDARMAEAIDTLRVRKISELPVVDADGRPVGMLDITDLIGREVQPPGGSPRPPLRLFDKSTE